MLASNEIIMPVLGMNQDTGKIVRWLVAEGKLVKKGEPLLEVEKTRQSKKSKRQSVGFWDAFLPTMEMTFRLGL
jgi:pyruvate dehydrogenase E2 component (dihydrolipoamide acetyltransferase)